MVLYCDEARSLDAMRLRVTLAHTLPASPLCGTQGAGGLDHARLQEGCQSF